MIVCKYLVPARAAIQTAGKPLIRTLVVVRVRVRSGFSTNCASVTVAAGASST
jgi:hypothetical protein